jgi:thiol-disulfide isomerase/thioredoxin
MSFQDPRRASLKMIKRLFFLFVLLSARVFEAAAQNAGPELGVQPEVLKASEYGIGHLVPDVIIKDLQGREMSLSKFKGNKTLVILIFSADCPISNKLGPELRRLEKEYAEKPVIFLLVTPVAVETTSDIMEYVSKYQLQSTVVHDVDGALANRLGATTTTESFVLDAARTLAYRGAINDQYGLSYGKNAPTRTYLRDALDAVLRGVPPVIAATTAPGCALDLPKAQANITKTVPTYHNQVSRILQANCVECHHPGGVAPFSLETSHDVIANAGMIKQQVARGKMPPWFAARTPGQTESPWVNDRSLSAQDKADLLAWLNSDRPPGDPADAPIARTFSSQWNIGEPEVIFQLPEPVSVKAEGFMPYQHRTIQTSFPEDRWVQAYEIMPTARSVVHHAIVSLQADTKDADSLGELGATGFWAVYVPGYTYRIYPRGYARKLPAGAKLNFQIHYTPNGQATQDQLKIGLIFSKQPPQYEIHALGIPQPGIDIPAGVHRHVETAEYHVSADMNVTGYQAHTHLRGKAFRYELIATNGETETLLDIPNYDFNWQLQYDYVQPRFIPAGSTIKVLAVYDNSVDNPANPDPTKNVKWGDQTYDEMLIGYVEYYRPRRTAAIPSTQIDSTNALDHPRDGVGSAN